MKKKYLPLILLSFVFVVIAFVFFKKESTQRIVVNGIGNFNPVPSNGKNYLLFYPADLRVSQKNTIVKEVTNQGDIVREYEIKDRDIRRMSFHQKPNDINKLYISFFGEATIDNYYFTYNIKEKKFTKVNLNYFEHKVGVDHIIHYGDDILFQTLVSHKTGEQNVNLENNEFNVSISDYSIKKILKRNMAMFLNGLLS
ncbi:hypothetical protein [Bacillus sp. mrc49]|uniref:hypothetical protein n=2 Tax=Bacillus sp. mrc49 TaxID=2054913 RepID=UPI000C273659|nr:hypothetical protein [Bacillus sp. mrc49]PJN88081.1 hypothetical protein CVN76_22480 [Bacillus sp. mrc49]